MQARALLLLALAAGCQAPSSAPPGSIEVPPEARDPIAAYAGRWIRRGPYNIIGAGRDTIWTIDRAASGWTIRLTIVHHPSVNEDVRTITREDFEPSALAWVSGALEFKSPRNPEQVELATVAVIDDKLHFPVVVQRDERTWEYRTWLEGGVMQCAHDPRVVPAGDATHPFARWKGERSTYRTRQVPSVHAPGTQVTAIEFCETSPQGVDVPCAVLVLEVPPNPPHIRRPGDSFHFLFAGTQYSRLSDEGWRAILAMPAFTHRVS
jgi:hypothetical protein